MSPHARPPEPRHSAHDPLADVEQSIAKALAATARAASPIGPAAADLLAPLERVSQGGKRLRARLLLVAHALHGDPAPHAAAQCAGAIELFQTAALIHDDVLDGADLRRGRPTIHRALQAHHEAESWTGDPTHFGTASAILAGDLALMAAQRLLAESTSALEPTRARTVAHLFADMAELCTAGQYLDMRLAAQPIDHLAHQRDDILATMRSKTASYTAEFPLAMGAATAGASPQALETMRRLGVPLGIAFQLRDDVLGLVGAAEVTGKPTGDDLREGKRTLLVAHAWAHGDERMRLALRAVFGNKEAPSEDIAAAVAGVVSTGAVEHVEEVIDHHAGVAMAAFEEAVEATGGVTDAARQLRELIDALVVRSA